MSASLRSTLCPTAKGTGPNPVISCPKVQPCRRQHSRLSVRRGRPLAASPSIRSFSEAAAGEWEGASATFSQDGRPQQLPDSLIPQALRDWDMIPCDWQTQVNMHASSDGLEYTVMRLAPTTGCEADEIARKEPVVKLGRSSAADSQRFVSNADGSYTACPAALASGARIEHCFMTKAGERVRLIQLLSSADEGWIATQVEVHHERKAGDALSHGRMLDLRENMSTFAEKSPLEADKLPQGWKPDRGTCCFFAGKEAAPVCGSRLPDRYQLFGK